MLWCSVLFAWLSLQILQVIVLLLASWGEPTDSKLFESLQAWQQFLLLASIGTSAAMLLVVLSLSTCCGVPKKWGTES